MLCIAKGSNSIHLESSISTQEIKTKRSNQLQKRAMCVKPGSHCHDFFGKPQRMRIRGKNRKWYCSSLQFVLVRQKKSLLVAEIARVRGGATNVLKCLKLSWRHGESQRYSYMRSRSLGFVLIRFFSLRFVEPRTVSLQLSLSVAVLPSALWRERYFTQFEIH